jgi:hypothetical protein
MNEEHEIDYLPGQKVWFEINGETFDGEVIEDDGGTRVSVDVLGAGQVFMYRHMLALKE